MCARACVAYVDLYLCVLPHARWGSYLFHACGFAFYLHTRARLFLRADTLARACPQSCHSVFTM